MNKKKFTRYLDAFDFKTLFNQLGYDHFNNMLPVSVSDEIFELEGVVEKKGFVILHCHSTSSGNNPDTRAEIPLSRVRRQIGHSVTKSYFEHLIIYTDDARSRQIWQIAIREPGKPRQVREVQYHSHQDTDGLFRRLKGLLFTLDEDESITLVDVKARATENFAKNAEKVTKKFYNEFKKHHTAFLKYVEGIDDALPDSENKNKQWYVSVMFSRLMFCYFIQKKGFLDQDINYLRNKLGETREKAGEDRFYDFYRKFLLQLFHQGLGRPEDKRDVSVELGRIPYLNGGLFDVHELENVFDDIQIRDEIFERIFKFFDEWNWHLDMRAEASGKDINPDVIGYIFEKYINDRAAMGAYYTKEDITEYIGKNCIVPFIYDEVRRRYKKPFRPDGEVWEMLRNSGDAYIYDAVKKGVELELPENIAKGVDTSAPNLLERRKDWNTPAPEDYALPTEIWRETVERRNRYGEVRQKIENGEITEINDFITYNLNIRQFTEDLIADTDDPKLIREFYKTVAGYTPPESTNEKPRPPISVLDPTCGSGAFLFAALNILEPIYEGCIERMEQLADESPKKDRCFEKVLGKVNAPDHPSRKYFICKSVILNNLHGADIMREAVEIAKLRLFLRIVASVDMNPSPRKPNYGLKPLPDMDFNIRAGNTLVGFATEKELTEVTENREGLFAQETLETFKEECEQAGKAFGRFKDAQIIEDMNKENFKATKQEVTKRLGDLNDKLNLYLASVYNIESGKQKKQYEKWLASHQPFHWFAEFYSIVVDRGGFDVVIGNPPYVEYSKVKKEYEVKGYKTEKCGNIFTMVMERSLALSRQNSRFGLIVPISSVSTPRMSSLMDLLDQALPTLHISNYAVRPDKLFTGADMNLSIHIGCLYKHKHSGHHVFSSNCKRWYSEYRPHLFTNLTYCNSTIISKQSTILKKTDKIEGGIWNKVAAQKSKLPVFSNKDTEIFYHSGGRYFRKCIFEKLSNEYKPLTVPDEAKYHVAALLTSNLYYWYWLIVSDTYHVIKADIFNFQFPKSALKDSELESLGKKLLDDLWANSSKRKRNRKDGATQIETNFIVGKSKHIIDQIDRVLAKHYGFTDEELDFIINYDIRYRMGKDLNP